MPSGPIYFNITADGTELIDALWQIRLDAALAEDKRHTYAENIARIVREFRTAQADRTFTLPMDRYLSLRVIAAGDRAGIDQDAVSQDYQDELEATAF